MSISVLARRHGVNGHTFRKQYKEVISGYRSWSQGSHAESYILYPENLGPDLSLDETSLSNGEVYTVLTNKSAHGRNGSLVAMVRGVATDTVSQVLMRLPHEKRFGVSTVTTDLSSAMKQGGARCARAMGARAYGQRGDDAPGHGQKPARHTQARVKVERAAEGTGGGTLRQVPRPRTGIPPEHEADGTLQQEVHTGTGQAQPGTLVQ